MIALRSYALSVPSPLVPKTPPTGLFLPTVHEVVDMLSRGPEQVRRMVKEVHVSPGRNPSDSYWATKPGYTDPNFRSFMTAESRCFNSLTTWNWLTISATIALTRGRVLFASSTLK